MFENLFQNYMAKGLKFGMLHYLVVHCKDDMMKISSEIVPTSLNDYHLYIKCLTYSLQKCGLYTVLQVFKTTFSIWL